MKECFCCCLWSMIIGAGVGVALVVSNKKVEEVAKKGKEIVTETIDTVKEKLNSKKSKKQES